MKIAIICQNYPPAIKEGGISHYSRYLAKSLSEIGNEITIITGGDYLGTESDGLISVVSFKNEWTYKTIKKIIQYLRNHKIDIVNIQYSPVMYSPIFKLTLHMFAKNFIMITSFHTLLGGSKFNYLSALLALLASHRIIATNSEILYLIRKYFPFFIKKSLIIPIGPNIIRESSNSDLNTVVAKYNLDEKLPVISYFGMLYRGKGMELLFNSSRLLEKKYKLKFQLLIIGGGISDTQDYIDDKKKKIHELGIESKIIWTGNIPADEVSALFKLSRIVVLPFRSGVSDRRGSLLAALAHNKAVVTTKPALNIPLFKNGENMIWPESDDVTSFAKTVIQVLDNNQLRQRLETGSAELAKHFCWSKIAEQTQSYFIDLLQNNLNYQYKVF